MVRRGDVMRFLTIPGPVLSSLAMGFLLDITDDSRCYTTSHGLWVHLKPGCRCGQRVGRRRAPR